MDSRNKRSDKNSELYRAITALDSLDDCYDFLVDLCITVLFQTCRRRTVC